MTNVRNPWQAANEVRLSYRAQFVLQNEGCAAGFPSHLTKLYPLPRYCDRCVRVVVAANIGEHFDRFLAKLRGVE